MKRAVICVTNPQDYINQLNDYSLMIVNPVTNPARLNYLLDNADWSLLLTADGEQYRNGGDYGNERALWYTSGTTGDSKFRSFTKQQLEIQAKTICDCYNITANDRYLSVMPLWHSHGQGLYWAMQHIAGEVKYINPTELLDSINFDPTFISAIPDFLKLFTRHTFRNLRFVRSASSSLPNALYYKLKEWSGTPVIESFGMTESASHCFTNPLYGEQRIGTVGLPSGIEAKIIDSQLYIQGPSVFQPGWLATGDLAEQDSSGYYRILGRIDDRLNIKGYKIDPVSIENQMYNLVPEINEIVIFGSDRVMCVYTGEIDEGTIRKALTKIDIHCNPRFLKKVDKIPVNSANKISRSLLKELYK
jgi:acyl-coenzyme A synthetase/AMP-(fatty) acid ligase